MPAVPRKFSQVFCRAPSMTAATACAHMSLGRGRVVGRFLAVSLVTLLLLPGSAWGGLYNPCEPDEGPFVPEWSGFKSTLLRYRSFGMDKIQFDNPARQHYFLMQQLAMGSTDKLTILQKLSLNEYLIRRGDAQKAKMLLLPLVRNPQGNFLLLCNMATACQQLAESKKAGERGSEYETAIDYMQEALKIWPAAWEDLADKTTGKQSEQQQLLIDLNWSYEGAWSTYSRSRTAEEYYLKLLKSRKREAVKKIGAEDTVDALFTDSNDPKRAIRYVDEKGEFSPGKLAESEKALLPEKSVDEAIKIVQQLLIWLPMDKRLYRQLGELYNAQGTPKGMRAAKEIFDDLVWNMQSRNPDLLKRRQVLEDTDIPPDPPNLDVEDRRLLDDESLKKMSPEQLKKIMELAKLLNEQLFEELAPIKWNVVGISLAFGFAVGLVSLWQVQELMRRYRRSRANTWAERGAAQGTGPHGETNNQNSK